MTVARTCPSITYRRELPRSLVRSRSLTVTALLQACRTLLSRDREGAVPILAYIITVAYCAAAGIGRGVASPGSMPIDHLIASTHIFWMSGRSQVSKVCPRVL